MTDTGVITLAELLPNLELPESAAAFSVSVEAQFCLDSRRVRAGDVFVALPSFHGANDGSCEAKGLDGRDFIPAAIEQGAALVLTHSDGDLAISERQNTPIIALADLAAQLSEISGRFYAQPSRELLAVGITGTNGKTTCSQLLAQVFAYAGHTPAVIGTLGAGLLSAKAEKTGFTTPHAAQCQQLVRQSVQSGADMLAIEVSSHALEQGRVSDIQFDAAVFTNLSRDHLDYHGSMVHYAAAKARLFTEFSSSVQVVNIDDQFGAQLYRQLREANGAEQLLSVSRQTDADISVSQTSFTPAGVGARVSSPWGEFTLEAPLYGGFNLDNCLAVFATACALGLQPNVVLLALENLAPVSGRMESVISGSSDIQVLVDFAHTPDALKQALTALKDHQQKKLVCLFGCGGDRDQGKRAQMGAIAEQLADSVWLTSDNPRSEDPKVIIDDILSGLVNADQVHVEQDRACAIAQVIARAEAGDCILIAGKGHETEQIFADHSVEFSDITHAQQALEVRT